MINLLKSALNTPSIKTLYKTVRILSPYSKKYSNLKDYDNVLILLQSQSEIKDYSTEIDAEFFKLIGIVIGASVFIFLIIGFCVFRSTKRITRPIQQLTKLT